MTAPNSLPWICWMASALCFAQRLEIRVYDYAGLSIDEIEKVTNVAGLVLGHAGLPVNWAHCRGAAAPQDAASRCEAELENGTIVLRLLAREPDRPEAGRRALGSSVVTAEGGRYSSMFVPAVRAHAREIGAPIDLLLGYALAHETGHCLLGPGHSGRGLMRAEWDRTDAREISRLSLGLTQAEAKKAATRLVAAR